MKDLFLPILYEVGLLALMIVSLPKLLYQCLFLKKYRKSLPQRLGMHFPKIDKGNRPLIWIHAVSVGETIAVSALARQLKKVYPEAIFVISSTTETGHEEAKRSLPFADHHVYLTFDLRFIVNRIVKRTAPNLVILSETDFWLNFLQSAKSYGAKIALVNGKLSQRSMARFQKFPFFSKKLFSLVDIFCVQNKLYADRFVNAGISEDKLLVTGNLKFDADSSLMSSDEVAKWSELLGIEPNQLVLTIGSTHDPEEKLLLATLKKIWQEHPHLKVLLVPRHPERFNIVADLLTQEKIPFLRFTKANKKRGGERVILVDAMGILKKSYQLSHLAFVGGSFTSKVGGHNILEPSCYGVPVLFGPHMHTQTELVELVEKYGCGKQVSEENLYKEMCSFLENSTKRAEYGASGKQLLKDLKGATSRTGEAILSLINGK
jgi:3-deoxy-D-manno-octulosonic-acid transferase